MRITLWNDPQDCGLRMESGWVRCPRDFHESNPGVFQRVWESTRKRLQEEVGDMMPQSPGEFSHIEVRPSFFQVVERIPSRPDPIFR